MSFLIALLDGGVQGLIWGIFALGVFISFRLLDFADLTVESSFACGGATTAALVTAGVPAWAALLIAVCAGGLAGLVTALLHTKLRIPPILAGILTMIGLFSINIAIMGTASNISLNHMVTIFGGDDGFLGIAPVYRRYVALGLSIFLVAAIGAILYWFFGTEIGSAVRATGDNAKMCRAQGINTDNTKILGLVISNALVGMSGSIFAQYQTFADVNMGVGSIVIGLAAVIIGESLFGKNCPFWLKLLSVVAGSIVYRIIIALAILWDIFDPFYLKLLTAVIVAIALSIPTIRERIAQHARGAANRKKFAVLDAQSALKTESAPQESADIEAVESTAGTRTNGEER